MARKVLCQGSASPVASSNGQVRKRQAHTTKGGTHVDSVGTARMRPSLDGRRPSRKGRHGRPTRPAAPGRQEEPQAPPELPVGWFGSQRDQVPAPAQHQRRCAQEREGEEGIGWRTISQSRFVGPPGGSGIRAADRDCGTGQPGQNRSTPAAPTAR
jgi:hypothetical protein